MNTTLDPGSIQLVFCIFPHFIDPCSKQRCDSLIASATNLLDNVQLCLTKCGFHLIKGSVGVWCLTCVGDGCDTAANNGKSQ